MQKKLAEFLSASLYEMLTQRKLFDTDDRAELIRLITQHSPKSPRAIEPGISRDFETVILKSIEKNPNSRYTTAEAFANDLQRIVDGRPVSARRLTLVEQAVRWCRKHPLVTTFATLFAISLIVGAAVSATFALKANQARGEARLGQQQSEETLEMFFGTFFPLASPDKGAKMNTEVRATMDAAVDSIIASDRYDPVVVGKLFNKLGWIYFNQQDYPRALEVFEHSNRVVTKAESESHEVALTALDHVGMTLMRLNRHQESEAALMSAWIQQAETLGKEHPSTIHSYAKLGDLYHHMGKIDEAIRITTEVLRIRSQPGREDSRFQLTSMNGLALLYLETEKPALAIDYLETVLDLRTGDDASSLGAAYNLHNLANAYRQNGDLEKAVTTLATCLKIREQQLDPTSDSMLTSRTLAAGLMADQGDPQSALESLERIWEQAETTDMEAHKGKILFEIARCLQQLENYNEAIAKYRDAYRLLSENRSPKHLLARQAIDAIKEIETKLQ